MFENRHSYDSWVVPAAQDKALTEAKSQARLPEMTALVEAAQQASSPEELSKALNKLRSLLAAIV